MWPILNALMISVLSMVSISECKWWALIPILLRYCATSSANLIVSTVTKVRSPFAIRALISESKSPIWPSVSLTSIVGSSKPVGLISILGICSIICSMSYILSASGCFFAYSGVSTPPPPAICRRPRGASWPVVSQRWSSSLSPGVALTYTI